MRGPAQGIGTLLAAFLTLSSLAAAQDNRIQIRVVDPQGLPVPQAAVRIQCAGGLRSALAADSRGEASAACSLPAEFTASAAGFEQVRRRLAEPGEANVLVLALTPAIVRDSVDVVVSDAGLEVDSAVTGDALAIDRTGARTVFDAVEKLVPGAFVTSRGVLGYGISSNGTGQISIRGVGEAPNAAVLVVVDGRPDFQGEMGHPLPDFFSLTDVDRVSVAEGPLRCSTAATPWAAS